MSHSMEHVISTHYGHSKIQEKIDIGLRNIALPELYYHRPNCDFRGVKSILFRQGDIVMYMDWESDLYDFSDPEVRLKSWNKILERHIQLLSSAASHS